MITIKTKDEMRSMREGGGRLAWVLKQVLRRVKPGMKLLELDRLAEMLIEKKGGKPSFKMVPNYHWSTCINVNQGVVHGVPNDYRLKESDIVSLDIGMYYQGLHTDVARTFRITTQNDIFLRTGERALRMAVRAARPGNRVGDISAVIEKEIKRKGFSPVRTLTGHGIGRKLHEEPQIPCFLAGKIKKTPKLRVGMALAIEVIYTQGRPKVVLAKDGWTVETADKSLAGVFEDTVLITKKGPLNLTKGS